MLKHSLLSVSFLVVLLSCSETRSTKSLAEIGTYSLSEEHFEGAFKKFYYKTGQAIPINPTSKRSIFENEFYPMVLAHRAHTENVHQTEEAQEFYQNARKSILVTEFMEKFLLDTVSVSDRQVRDLFRRSKTYWRASHLFAETKREADSLYELLNKGRNFDELAKSVFNNVYMAKNGGDLGLFTVDEMDLAFEDALVKLNEGEISAPVKTSYGYSIIRLDKHLPEPIITETAYLNTKHHSEQIELKRQKHRVSDKFIEETISSLNIDENVLEVVTSELWSENKFALKSLIEVSISGINRSDKISDNGSFALTVDFVLNEIESSSDEQIGMINTKNKLKETIKGIVFRSYIVEKAIQNGLDESYKFTKTLEYRFYNYLAARMEERILDTVSVGQKELEKDWMYNSDIYIHPTKLHLQRIVVANEKAAERIYSKLKSGADFQEMASEYSIQGEDRMTDADLGYVGLDELGTIGQKLDKLSVGEFSEPIEYATNRFYLYKILDRVESKPKTFEEAKDEIQDRIKQRKLKQARKQLVNSVLEENGVEIDWDKISKIKVNV